MAGLYGLLRFRNLQRIPAGCPEHALWDRWQPGFLHLQRKGIRSSRFRRIRNPALQLRQGRGLAFIFAVSFNIPCISVLPERLIPPCGQQKSACSIRLCHCRLPASCITSDCLHSEWRKPSACKENIGNVLSTSAGPGFLARSASLPSAGLEASPRIAVSPAHDGLLVEKALRWQ